MEPGPGIRDCLSREFTDPRRGPKQQGVISIPQPMSIRKL